MDTLLQLSGTRPPTWSILQRGGGRVGQVQQNGDGFMVLADGGSPLLGIEQGPYQSLSEAMGAIAHYVGGVCEQPKRR